MLYKKIAAGFEIHTKHMNTHSVCACVRACVKEREEKKGAVRGATLFIMITDWWKQKSGQKVEHKRFSSHRAVNTFCLYYRDQPANAV